MVIKRGGEKLNKIGVHFGYFNRDWNTDFIKRIEQVKKIGLDILEVAPAPLLALTKFQRDEIAAAAKANDIELTFSVGLSANQDLASEDEEIRKMELNLQRILSKLCLKWAEKLIREWILQRGIRHLWKVLQIKVLPGREVFQQ